MVRRGATPAYAIELLTFLGTERRWPYCPTLIEADANHTVLAYVEGTAAISGSQRAAAAGDTALTALVRVVRELHDLTAGTSLAAGGEVACHNDLDPRNTIYRKRASAVEPVALIDWDLAGPGDRVNDLAHICWTYTGIGRGAAASVVRQRIETCLAAYDSDIGHSAVVDAMLWWQDRCWRGIVAEAAAGDPHMRALLAAGAVRQVQADYEWTRTHLLMA